MEQWVGDKLHEVLGISDKYLAQYMLGLATKSKSTDAFIEALRKTDTVPIDKEIITFAGELWNKVILHNYK